MSRGVLAAIVIFAAGTAAADGPGFPPIEVRALPIATFRNGSDETRFGELEFRGGLELASTTRELGSLSGLAFTADGQTLYSVADTGYWFRAKVVEENRRLTGIADPELGRMLLDNGKPPERKSDADAEGLRIVERDGKPVALVSFEQKPTVREYAGPDFASSTPTRWTLPKFVTGVRRNQGLEAIAVAPAGTALDGATLVIAERSLDTSGNHRGFILTGPSAGVFSIKRTGEFDISDAAFLPGGDLLILERSFGFSSGFAVRIRRIDGTSIKPGVTLDGPTLLEADGRYQIDNLEGLAVRTTAAGETILTLVSDDNSNLFQRTILLEFALLPPEPPTPAPTKP